MSPTIRLKATKVSPGEARLKATKMNEREKRLRTLLEWAQKNKAESVDPILVEARKRYPFLTKKTLRDYASTVCMILDKKLKT